MLEFFIAKKHILEKKKQSLIGILGITIGITVLMVSIGIANGLDKNMINSILSMGSHVSVANIEREDNYKQLVEKIEKLDGVKGVIPKVSTQGIIKYTGIYGTHVSGVKVDGIDFKKAEKGLNLSEKIVYGKMDSEKKNIILIGKELYNQLGAQIGDKITLVSAENQELPLVIGGVFESGYYDYDVNMVIIPLATAQYLMYLDKNDVTSLEVTLNNPYRAEEIADKIFEKYGFLSRTWGDQNRNLLSALALEKTVMIVVFSLIVIIAGFVVWVIMNMLVREKIKDIGIMRAMGFSKKTIMRIFLLEGMTLGGIGICVGTLLSLGTLWYVENYSISGITNIYYLTKIPVELSMKEIITIICVNIGIIFLSSVFPAYRAGKMETMEALRHE
ncbi:ABC transporter permease [Fusobacterium perfoetens]|uniref:ABC transporter permease n=1 Tax=Fusobacterium perfoetens TaxID=852 RepID=UPI0015A2A3B0|nr:ABC transporter permease [Fusobacterium perfoetens]MCF2624630.1 ABC transporter permease [Fusobacterium perfoetens]